MRRSQIVLFAVLGASVLIPFGTSTVDCVADTLPEDLPAWFEKLDTDQDGQISIQEWRKGKRNPAEFHKYDLNGDGFITPDEVLRVLGKESRLELRNGQASYRGSVYESPDDTYQGKKSFKVLPIKLKQGKTYQIEMISRAYFAYLYLEDPNGDILDQNDSGGVNQTARIIHRAARSGTYRIIATSQGGFRTGPFSLAVRVADSFAGLPPWFRNLDKDQDGQISRKEWRKAGRKPEDFDKYDPNGDDFITPEEVLRIVKKNHLELKDGQLDHRDAIEEAKVERYQGKRSFKIFTIKLEQGKTYRIEMTSPAYYSYLYLEDPNGDILAQHDSGGFGQTARIVHRTARTGTYRIIGTSLAGVRTGPFSLSIRVIHSTADLPEWFKELDTDHDGQISFQEWRQGGNKPDDFRKYDLNDDGFITPDEVQRIMKKDHLELENGKANLPGVVKESSDAQYQGKKAFKIYTIKLEQGKTYQIEQISQAYWAYLYLESPDGEILGQHDSGGRNRTARIVHRATRTGTYRIIATSQGGFRTGPFSLSISVVPAFAGKLPKGVPAWFKELDTDNDGQISLQEWMKGGNDPADFRVFDLNDDGFITADEVLRYLKAHPEPTKK
jgi:Ca2+-binding EF-hand superfamily protein